MAEKIFYSMGEVAEMFDVKPSLVRHWEAQFPSIRPARNKKGNRLFTPRDVEQLKLIYHLVKEQGMTLEGAKKALRRRRSEDAVPRDVELLERLQRIRALLVEVREDLKQTPGEVVAVDNEPVGDGLRESATEAAPVKRRGRKPVVRIEEPAAEPAEETAGKHPGRKPRRKKEDAEAKELFAFYEQSLF